MWLYGKLK